MEENYLAFYALMINSVPLSPLLNTKPFSKSGPAGYHRAVLCPAQLLRWPASWLVFGTRRECGVVGRSWLGIGGWYAHAGASWLGICQIQTSGWSRTAKKKGKIATTSAKREVWNRRCGNQCLLTLFLPSLKGRELNGTLYQNFH